MKECPECGSVLADNEPYCENCGYDPDFDGGGWRSGSANTSPRPYPYTKKKKSSSGDEIPLVFIVAAILCFAWLFYVIFFL